MRISSPYPDAARLGIQYHQLRAQDGNLFLSPFSSTPLAMPHAGARGHTELELLNDAVRGRIRSPGLIPSQNNDGGSPAAFWGA
jgi:hypothetical protein